VFEFGLGLGMIGFVNWIEIVSLLFVVVLCCSFYCLFLAIIKARSHCLIKFDFVAWGSLKQHLTMDDKQNRTPPEREEWRGREMEHASETIPRRTLRRATQTEIHITFLTKYCIDRHLVFDFKTY